MDCSLCLPYPWSHLWHPPKFGFSRSMLGKEWPKDHLPNGGMGVSQNNGTPKSSILIGVSILNHPFWGTPIFGNIRMKNHLKQTNPRKTTHNTPFSLKPISTYTPVDLKIFLEAPPRFSCGRYGGMKKKHPHAVSCIQKQDFRSTSFTSILKVSKSFRISTKAFHCRSVSAKICQKPEGPKRSYLRDHFWSADSGWFLPEALSLV